MKLNAGARNTLHRPRRRTLAVGVALSVVWLLAAGAIQAQAPVARPVMPSKQVPAPAAAPAQATMPAMAEADTDYVIGPTDVLAIVIWEEKDLSSEVVVRPDGKISLPLLNDVVAAGLTPEQLRRQLTERLKRFVKVPVVTVVVKQVNNNRAFITGQVARPGPYVLSGPMTVMHMLAMAGGFTEFADRGHVLVMRIENGVQRSFAFNYDRVIKRQDLSQNIILKAGDTVVVP